MPVGRLDKLLKISLDRRTEGKGIQAVGQC